MTGKVKPYLERERRIIMEKYYRVLLKLVEEGYNISHEAHLD
jgi:hypothetical protein